MFKKTKEKINQNEYVVFIKKMWANKRYRSLLILMLYFVFFFVIITGLRDSYNVDENTTNYFSFDKIKEEYNNLTSYSYEILINEESIIIGNMDNSLNNFVYDGKKYTVINNVMYEENDDSLKKVDLTNADLVLSIFDKLMLDDLVNYISPLNKSGVINENSFVLDYEVPNTYFSIEEEDIIKVSILGDTMNKIDEVIINLTNYEKEEMIIKMKVSDKNV